MCVFKYFYGLAAILFALDGMWFGILGEILLPLFVLILGVLIMFTPMGGQYTKPTLSQQVRRWFFGAFIVIIGLVPLIQNYTGPFIVSGWIELLHWVSIEVFSGQLILLLIGVIYFFAGTKVGNRPLYSE